MSELLPEHFRKCRTGQEQANPGAAPTEPRSQKVPLDADQCQNRIDSLQKRFRKALLDSHSKTPPGPQAGGPPFKGCAWSVATGEWVPKQLLIATPVFPATLGPSLAAHLVGTRSAWQDKNGLLLPAPMKQAFEDWALTIVPRTSKIPIHPGGTEYIVRTTDPQHPSLSQELYPRSQSFQPREPVVAKDLDGKTLAFVRETRPWVYCLYFHSCCSVWKQVYLSNPRCNDAAEFWVAFLGRMLALWPTNIVVGSSITNIFNPQREE